jgi:hypothetical protein
MYLDRIRRRVKNLPCIDQDEIHPCTPAEIEALEQKLGCPLPAAVREFLLWCGHQLADVWRGARCLGYDELLAQFGRDQARDTLAEEGLDPSLIDERTLIFQFDECDQFSYLRLDEGDDPPVY